MHQTRPFRNHPVYAKIDLVSYETKHAGIIYVYYNPSGMGHYEGLGFLKLSDGFTWVGKELIDETVGQTVAESSMANTSVSSFETRPTFMSAYHQRCADTNQNMYAMSPMLPRKSCMKPKIQPVDDSVMHGERTPQPVRKQQKFNENKTFDKYESAMQSNEFLKITRKKYTPKTISSTVESTVEFKLDQEMPDFEPVVDPKVEVKNEPEMEPESEPYTEFKIQPGNQPQANQMEAINETIEPSQKTPIEIQRVESLAKIETIIEKQQRPIYDSDSDDDDDFFSRRNDGIDTTFLFGAGGKKKPNRKVTVEQSFSETITRKAQTGKISHGAMDVDPEECEEDFPEIRGTEKSFVNRFSDSGASSPETVIKFQRNNEKGGSGRTTEVVEKTEVFGQTVEAIEKVENIGKHEVEIKNAQEIVIGIDISIAESEIDAINKSATISQTVNTEIKRKTSTAMQILENVDSTLQAGFHFCSKTIGLTQPYVQNMGGVSR